MILPRDIKTKNKIRDAKIINDWKDGKSQEEIANELGLTRHAIYSIIRKNRPAIKIDKEFEKVSRLHDLKNQLRKCGNTEKDRLDVLEAMRKECEGGDNSSINFVNQFFSIEQNSPLKNRLSDALKTDK